MKREIFKILNESDKIKKIKLINEITKNRHLMDDCLKEYCDLIENEQNIFLLGVLLRNGADPNLYVIVPDVGEVHIMCYLIMKCKNRNIKNNIINVLLSILYDSGANIYSSSVKNAVTQANFLTVEDWVYREGYRIEHASKDLNLIMDKELPSYEEFKPTTFFLCRATKIIYSMKNYSYLTKTFEGEYIMIRLAIDCNYYTMFEILLEKGVHITYYSINRILAYMKEDKSYYDMFLLCAKAGIQIDKYQFDFFRKIYPEKVQDILDVYEKPVWEKLCSHNKSNPSLRKLANEFNLYYSSNDSICKKLKEISLMTPSDFKELIEERTYNRMKLYGLKSKCYNEIDKEYSDTNFSFYEDDESKVWCFTSDMYENLIQTKTNPYNNEKIPDYFLNDIENSLKLLKDLKIVKPENILDAKNKLTDNDYISNIKTDTIIKSINDILVIHNINLDDINNMQISLILDSLDFSQSYLNELPEENIKVTFKRSLHSYIKRNRENIENVMKKIKSII